MVKSVLKGMDTEGISKLCWSRSLKDGVCRLRITSHSYSSSLPVEAPQLSPYYKSTILNLTIVKISNMALFRTLVGRLSLLSLLYCTAFAAPATNHSEVDLVKRAPGDSRNEPIDAHFDTDGWSTIAEQDCYIALCILGGNRVLYV